MEVVGVGIDTISPCPVPLSRDNRMHVLYPDTFPIFVAPFPVYMYYPTDPHGSNNTSGSRPVLHRGFPEHPHGSDLLADEVDHSDEAIVGVAASEVEAEEVPSFESSGSLSSTDPESLSFSSSSDSELLLGGLGGVAAAGGRSVRLGTGSALFLDDDGLGDDKGTLRGRGLGDRLRGLDDWLRGLGDWLRGRGLGDRRRGLGGRLWDRGLGDRLWNRRRSRGGLGDVVELDGLRSTRRLGFFLVVFFLAVFFLAVFFLAVFFLAVFFLAVFFLLVAAALLVFAAAALLFFGAGFSPSWEALRSIAIAAIACSICCRFSSRCDFNVLAMGGRCTPRVGSDSPNNCWLRATLFIRYAVCLVSSCSNVLRPGSLRDFFLRAFFICCSFSISRVACVRATSKRASLVLTSAASDATPTQTDDISSYTSYASKCIHNGYLGSRHQKVTDWEGWPPFARQ